MSTDPTLTAAEMAEAIDMYGFTLYSRPSATVKRRMIDLTRLADLSFDPAVRAIADLPWTNAGTIGTTGDGRYFHVQSEDGQQIYVLDRTLIKVGAARWTL